MNVLVVQRQSLVAGVDFSLSVQSRIIEAMDWLMDQGIVQYAVCGEKSPEISRMLRWADAVIFSKHFSIAAQSLARQVRLARCATLLDIDDWIFSFPEYSGGHRRNQSRFDDIEAMLGLVDVVTVSNKRLLDEVSRYRSDAILAPNGIYVERYPLPTLWEESKPVKIVFSNADFIKLHSFKHDFLRLLQDIARKYPEIVFDFYGDPFPELLSLPFLHFTYRIPYQDHVACLASGGYSLAITPLGGEEDAASYRFNTCKNPIKYLNYGIAGIPCIFSDVPIYQECVQHGETGFLSENTHHAWQDTMEVVLKNENLRHIIRNKCYDDICKNYHIKKASQIFYDALYKCKNANCYQDVLI